MDMITPSIQAGSKLPIYQQLYRYIKEEIRCGKIPYNSKLPSKRKLSSFLNISQNTIQTAYDQLIEEGYIIALEKKGFFVCEIDHLQNLKLATTYENQTTEPDVCSHSYDFSYHGVDMPTFPYGIWRRLSKEVINEYDDELLTLGDSLGYHRLRAAIAGYLHQSRGVNCSYQQVIISSGTEILFQSLIQLFSQDYIYGIENPGYEKLYQLFTGNRANFCSVNIDESGMLLSDVKSSNANILCLTPAHQFPSGHIMPINRRIQLLNWANASSDRYIIEDDYDSEFKYSGKPVPALQGLDTNDKVIYMGSLSKSISPTLRVSYMVLPPQLIKRYHKNLSYLLCPVPIIEQKVLCRFIEEGYFERHLNKMRNIYKRKREVLVEAITSMNCDIGISGADAGLHLLLHIPNSMNEEQLITSALSMGVKVYGISKYYFDKSYLPKEPVVLLGFAMMSEENIKNSLKLLWRAWFPSE